MVRRLRILLLAFASLLPAETPYERLAATAKLWAFVKYMHPRVTAGEVDWDAAFVKAAPKVLDASSEQDFAAAVGEMLASLKDPGTRVMPSGAELMGDQARDSFAVSAEDGVTVVRLGKGDMSQAMESRNTLVSRLSGAGAVVFDLRGSRIAPYLMPPSLPVSKASIGPSILTRRHAGYANEAGSGSGGYQSTWEIHEGMRLQPAAVAIRPVFLVNRETSIPPIALAIQSSGAGAIVSEDPIDDRQVDLTRPVPMFSSLRVLVRTRELSYPDGTSGVAANVVLNKTGDEALNVAKDLARSGKWPAAARPTLDLPPAMFTERNYVDQPYPNAEYRMLAAARIWGVFHYFHPYLNLYGEDWDRVLTESLPKMAHAENTREYHLAVAEMVSHTHDSHCYMTSPELTDFYGRTPPGVEVRWIENQPVITRVVDQRLDRSVRPGDVVTKIDGEPVQKRMDDLERRLAASTEQSMKNRVMGLLLNGPGGSTMVVSVRTGGGAERKVPMTRDAANQKLLFPYRSGPVYRPITPKIGYVDLARLPNPQVDAMFDVFKDTDAIVMDMRGYPQGTAWSIAPRLAEKPATVAAQFRRNVVSPDAVEGNYVTSTLFEQRIPTTDKPRYRGKTVMLIDDRAISQSEHSGLFYRAANGTVFIGSPTQGANGDVTWFMAPGGIRINFSGHDVRWPDGKQLQRVGLTPDIEVRPTIAGIQAGRDEVLERAIAYIEKGR